MLKPVSETFIEDRIDHNQPAYPAIFDTPQDFDLNDPLAFKNGQPFEFYQKLHEHAPVAWVPIKKMTGYWAITKYDDVRHIETHPQIFSSQKGGIMSTYGTAETKRHKGLHEGGLNTLICLDQPHHIPLRMQHRSFFSPEYVAGLRGRVEEETERLIDQMVKAGPVLDLVHHFSNHVPLFTVCEILGIEKKDRAQIIRWVHYLESSALKFAEREKGRINLLFFLNFNYQMWRLLKYGKKELHKRRRNPREDLLSAIASAKVDGDTLSDQFLDGSWLLVIFAGNDTSRNSISGTMRLLTQFPEQKQKLLDDPSKIGNMVSEAIRMVSPVIYMRRTATQDTEIRGQKIANGEKLVMFYGAANRDPEIFSNPNVFDIERPNAKDHIAFGLGPHVCLGKRIAQMQMEVAYEQLLQRFPNIQWTGKQSISANNFVSAISRLEVDLGTRPKRSTSKSILNPRASFSFAR